MDAAVEPQPAERIVYMRRISSKEGAAFAEHFCYTLMNLVETAMNDRVSAALWKELLKPALDSFTPEDLIVGLTPRSGKQYAPQATTIVTGDLEQGAPLVGIREIIARAFVISTPE